MALPLGKGDKSMHFLILYLYVALLF